MLPLALTNAAAVEPRTTLDPRIRFGNFEVDLRAGELRKQGVKIRLQDQPYHLLVMLLERPGEVIRREQLQERIWPSGTFVDFENGLNKAINKLREALGDSTETPRFIETVPRRGYRFIAPLGGAPSIPEHVRAPTRRRWVVAVVGGASVALVAIFFGREMSGTRKQASNRTALRPIESIAVLPLENLSHNSADEYFADGITEALITDLGQLRTLRVISRTSAMRYKGSKKLLPEIARELNVDAVIEGTVLQSGKRVRITAQLIRAVPEKELWAETYERDLRDVLAMQDDVARAIANEISMNVPSPQPIRVARIRRPVDPQAYEAYLKGRYEGANWSEGPRTKSVKYLEQAVRRDPTYAEAWAALSTAYAEVGYFGWAASEMARTKSREAALKALELDDTNAEAHTTLAWLLHGDWSWTEARKELQRAIALDPNNSRAHQIYGFHLMLLGQCEEAVVEMNRALMLDPFSGNKHNSLGAALFCAERDGEALEQFRQAPDPDVNSALRHWRMAVIYERKGMEKEAVAELMTSLKLRARTESASLVEQEYLSSGFASAKRKFLQEEIQVEVAKASDRPGRARTIAGDYALLGETEQALEWLKRAVSERDQTVIFIKSDYHFRALHSDPRFQDLVRRMGLPS